MSLHALSKQLKSAAATIACLVPAVLAAPAMAAENDLDAVALAGLEPARLVEDAPFALDSEALGAGESLDRIASLSRPSASLMLPVDFDVATIAPDARLAWMRAKLASQGIDVGAEPEGEQTSPELGLNDTAMGPAWTDHVPREFATHRSFGSQVGSIKTELLLFAAYFSMQSGKKLFRETTSFHFHDEGWFGKNTGSLGLDKMLHAFDTYLIAEILHMRLHKNTNASEGDAVTAAILASTLMALNEISDGIEPDSGYSMQDITMNTAGALFSVLRNTVPGMREKVSFKVEIVPNDDFYSYRGKKHYEQQRYLFSLKGRGFKALDETPFHYLDLQVGYYGSDFLKEDIAAGLEPKRHVFVGVGLNLGEILFGKTKKTGFAKGADLFLDYMQLPYTSLRIDNYGELSY